ncbi:hypothetical protein GEMRC1_010567 [Eukaryota sp. GEM-RC1]
MLFTDGGRSIIPHLYLLFGSVKPEFKIFLTISNHKLYKESIEPFISRTAVNIQTSYPGVDVVQELCRSYNLSNWEEVFNLTGPSLFLVLNYAMKDCYIARKCQGDANQISNMFFSGNNNLERAMLEFTTLFTNDYIQLDLRNTTITPHQFDTFVSGGVLSGLYHRAFFQSPLYRRAACTVFAEHNLPSCNVTLCNDV